MKKLFKKISEYIYIIKRYGTVPFEYKGKTIWLDIRCGSRDGHGSLIDAVLYKYPYIIELDFEAKEVIDKFSICNEVVTVMPTMNKYTLLFLDAWTYRSSKSKIETIKKLYTDYKKTKQKQT